MRTLTLLTCITLLALPLTGCVGNMGELKDKLTGASAEPAPETPPVDTPPGTDPVDDAEKVARAPVARMKVFGENGALLFASTFLAEDGKAPVSADPKSKLTVNAGESAALEPGATLATYEWTFGEQKATGRQATIEMFADPGLAPLKLVVTDSNGAKDEQNLTLAIMPEPFEVALDLQTGQLAGASNPVDGSPVAGETATIAFDVAHEIDGKMVTAQRMTVVVSPDLECDVAVELKGPDGASLGVKDDGGAADLSQTESYGIDAPAVGAWTLDVSPFTCADPDGVPVEVTVTYIQVIEGLDGHGGHAGH